LPKGIRADGQPQKGRKQNPRGVALRKKAMLAALEKSLGIVTHAAREIGIDRNTHYAWMKDDPEYRAAAETIDDAVVDFGETALFNNVKQGKEASIIFLLKCKGRKRGYIEKSEVNGNLNVNLATLFVADPTEQSEGEDPK
jgi:hypothetical protein